MIENPSFALQASLPPLRKMHPRRKRRFFLSGMTAVLALVAGGQAEAQTSQVQSPVSDESVTFFGVVDIYGSYGKGSNASKTQLASGGNTASRWGFKGYENLGGGIAAGFWLEGSISMDTGSYGTSNVNNTPSGTVDALFGRRATVSLMDFWGEVRLGRDFNPTYRNRDQTDPFSNNGAGNSQPNAGTLGGSTATRVSNSIAYFLPAGLGGLFGEAQYFMGENAHVSGQPNVQDGDGYGARIGWGSGPFSIAVATGLTQYTRTATTGDIQVVNVGAGYDFGVVRITAGYFRDEVKSSVPVVGDGYIVGAVVPIGASQFKASFSSYGTSAAGEPRADKLALGYVYNLSKRTLLYTTYAYVRNDGGSAVALNGSLTAPNAHSQGVDVGMKHSF